MKRAKRTFKLQQGQSDCGVACLLSIIRYHDGQELTLERLREISGTSKKGTTMLGLFQASKSLGFEVEGLEAESIENLMELNQPSILYVVLEGNLQHYIVYYGVVDGQYIIGDPAKGILLLSAQELVKIWVNKTLLKLSPDKAFKLKSVNKKSKKSWFLSFIEDDISLLLVALTIGGVISVLTMSTAVFSQKLIDNILPSGSTSKLILSLFLLSVLLIARSGLSYVRNFFLINQSRAFNNRIIKKFYGKLLRLPKSFFDNRKVGELIARMNDTRRIQSTISTLFGSLLIDLLVMCISIIFIFVYSWVLGIACIGFIPLYVLLVYRYNDRIILTQKSVMSKYALVEGNYIDTINGMSTIKVHNLEILFEKVNKRVYEMFQNQVFSLGKINIKLAFISEAIGVFFLLSVFSIASWLVLENDLLIGELVAITSLSSGIIPVLGRFIAANIQLQEVKVIFERMFEFTDIDSEFDTDQTSKNVFWKSLELENISFRFTGRPELLSDVSLEVNRGQMITILGESGSGKSTIFQVLQRFYQNEKGTIKINKEPLDTINIPEWRSTIGIVPQEIKIFNGSLVYNVGLNEREEDLESVILFCTELGLDQFFKRLSSGYHTLVGEEGVKLSGGQKQLVALARALYKKPQLLLLDEATSAMDKNTENYVLELLSKLIKSNQLGIVMVSHRIKIAQKSDFIYILENGKTVIKGTPKELMQSSNLYSDSLKELII